LLAVALRGTASKLAGYTMHTVNFNTDRSFGNRQSAIGNWQLAMSPGLCDSAVLR